jgi:hypothetical protein
VLFSNVTYLMSESTNIAVGIYDLIVLPPDNYTSQQVLGRINNANVMEGQHYSIFALNLVDNLELKITPQLNWTLYLPLQITPPPAETE